MRKAHITAEAGFDPREPAKRGVKLFEFVLVLALFLAGVVWLVGAYPNQDPLWFSNHFDARPSVIRIYHYGTVREIKPSDREYAELVSIINALIPHDDGYFASLYPRDSSLKHYQTKGYAVEMEYASPVRVHTRQYFPPARRLMIALDGTFNYTKSVLLFRGNPTTYLPGGLVLENVDSLRAHLDTLLAQP